MVIKLAEFRAVTIFTVWSNCSRIQWRVYIPGIPQVGYEKTENFWLILSLAV